MKNKLKIAMMLAVGLWLCGGCTVTSYNRAFPKLTWYWSAAAQAERADKARENEQKTNAVPQK